MKRYTGFEVNKLNEKFVGSNPLDIVGWAVKTFGDMVSLASSFGAEDMVLLDMLVETTRSPRVFVLDTGRLHQETYDVMTRARERYDIEFEFFFPQCEAVEMLLSAKGPNSFLESIENRKECCFIRKVEPLSRALSTVDAWTTGLRKEQSVTRGDLQHIEIDEAHGGILKINPLAEWSQSDVWEHIRSRDIPYNSLHDQGFPSIGCAPCTRAVKPGGDVRAGRWWWESPEHRECGLHIKNGKAVRK